MTSAHKVLLHFECTAALLDAPSSHLLQVAAQNNSLVGLAKLVHSINTDLDLAKSNTA